MLNILKNRSMNVTTTLITLATLALPSIAGEKTLVDYAPHGPTKKEGDFGSLTGTQSSWTPTAECETIQLKPQLPQGLGSEVNATLGRQIVANGGKCISFAQSTNHRFKKEDQFFGHFSWIAASRWHAQENEILCHLFVTEDNTLTGKRIPLHTWQSQPDQGRAKWQTDPLADTSLIHQPNALGKLVFIEFTSTAGVGQFARLDNVFLAVKNPRIGSLKAQKSPPVTPKIAKPTPKPSIKPTPTSRPEALVGLGSITIYLRNK
ncbi:hypothetical protein [Rubritalea tangerina]|uniref:PEP-CTERM sorting domain-containing protein n=1 Tax=Rubritalea tangerina TaxID=430798 RepID=A0ABW4ZF43_9BACT